MTRLLPKRPRRPGEEPGLAGEKSGKEGKGYAKVLEEVMDKVRAILEG
jgi:hypothetical protein